MPCTVPVDAGEAARPKKELGPGPVDDFAFGDIIRHPPVLEWPDVEVPTPLALKLLPDAQYFNGSPSARNRA
jgi:hypothetical protein